MAIPATTSEYLDFDTVTFTNVGGTLFTEDQHAVAVSPESGAAGGDYLTSSETPFSASSGADQRWALEPLNGVRSVMIQRGDEMGEPRPIAEIMEEDSNILYYLTTLGIIIIIGLVFYIKRKKKRLYPSKMAGQRARLTHA